MDLGIDIQGNLVPNPLTMATQLLATLLIFLMFRKFLWKPVREILAKRSAAMQDELDGAARARKEAEASIGEAHREVEAAREQGRQIVADARSEAEELREQVMREADAKAARRMADAEAEIAQRESDMRAELKDEVADLALLAAESLLREKVDEERDRKFVEDFLEGR